MNNEKLNDTKRTEDIIKILKKYNDDLKEIKDNEKCYYMRKRYQTIIDANTLLIKFINR